MYYIIEYIRVEFVNQETSKDESRLNLVQTIEPEPAFETGTYGGAAAPPQRLARRLHNLPIIRQVAACCRLGGRLRRALRTCKRPGQAM